MWKIKLTLIGGLTYELNDVRSGNPGWSDCQPVAIERLNFSFKGTDPKTGREDNYELVLAGMKEYNFFVEATRNILGGKTKIQGLWFLGKIPITNQIVGYVLKDTIARINAIDGQEYNGMSTVGWKPGIPDGIPFIDIIRR